MKSSETVHSECSYQDDTPNYRVNFWEGDGESAWRLQAFILSEVDSVEEAMSWVRYHANGRPAELFVEIDTEPIHAFDAPRKADLIRLYGVDPNAIIAPPDFSAFE